MPKPEGLFSIGEIATVCGVSIDTLRFYETKALITPAHVDPESGYRYYRRENLLRLRTILGLKDAGLSLLDIKDYLDGGKNTENKIAELTKRRDLLNRAIEDLQIRSVKPGDLTVSEIELPERLCLCCTIYAKDGVHALRAIGEFYDELARDGVPFSRTWPAFCEYPDEGLLKGEFPTTDFTVRACLPIDKKKRAARGSALSCRQSTGSQLQGRLLRLVEGLRGPEPIHRRERVCSDGLSSGNLSGN